MQSNLFMFLFLLQGVSVFFDSNNTAQQNCLRIISIRFLCLSECMKQTYISMTNGKWHLLPVAHCS